MRLFKSSGTLQPSKSLPMQTVFSLKAQSMVNMPVNLVKSAFFVTAEKTYAEINSIIPPMPIICFICSSVRFLRLAYGYQQFCSRMACYKGFFCEFRQMPKALIGKVGNINGNFKPLHLLNKLFAERGKAVVSLRKTAARHLVVGVPCKGYQLYTPVIQMMQPFYGASRGCGSFNRQNRFVLGLVFKIYVWRYRILVFRELLIIKSQTSSK